MKKIIALILVAGGIAGCAANSGESSSGVGPVESLIAGIFGNGLYSVNHLEVARYEMREMTARGYPATLSIFDPAALPAVARKHPRMPTDSSDVIGLAACIYTGELNGRPCGDEYELRNGRRIRLVDDAENVATELLFLGLRNPRIEDPVREQVDRLIAAELPNKPSFYAPFSPSRTGSGLPQASRALYSMASGASGSQWPSVGPCDEYVEYDASPQFQIRYCMTDKFWISYYYGPGLAYPDSAILSDDVIFQLAADLEVAWNTYEAEFGTAYLPELYEMVPGYQLLQLDFLKLSKNSASTVNGVTNSAWQYIALNPHRWNEVPGIRKPTSAHELFHRVQYRYGYSVNPTYDSAHWFVEGTAALAEALVWNQTSSGYKYTWLYEHPIADLFFSDEVHPWSKYAPAAANFWYFWEGSPGATADLFSKYETSGSITQSVDEVLYDRFGAAGVFNNLEDYLALWRRDKILGTRAPVGVLDENGQAVSPLNVELRRTKHFAPGGDSQWNGVLSMWANGTSYAMLYVDPLLKSGAQSLRLVFAPHEPGVPMQYQIVFAKCTNGLVACGIADQGWLESNVDRSDYQVIRTIYPFFAEHTWEYFVPLDSAELEWDLIYLVMGNRLATGGEEYINVQAELWDNP